jgi:hypothetical protein
MIVMVFVFCRARLIALVALKRTSCRLSLSEKPILIVITQWSCHGLFSRDVPNPKLIFIVFRKLYNDFQRSDRRNVS